MMNPIPPARVNGKRREWLKNTLTGVPDWVRRALRLSVALTIFALAGHGLLVPKWLNEEYHDEYQRSCVWAGVTAIVVNAPLIGRMAQTACERMLGTIAGGALGFVVYDYGARLLHVGQQATSIYLALCAAAVGAFSCFLAAFLKLDMTPRFFAITFLLVTMGAPAYGSAYVVALLRTGGILAGVLVMQFLAIIILPKSATIEALRNLQKALLHMCDMSDVVWACNDMTAYASHAKRQGVTPAGSTHAKQPVPALEPAAAAPQPPLDDVAALKQPLLQHVHDKAETSASGGSTAPGPALAAPQDAVVVVVPEGESGNGKPACPALHRIGSMSSLAASASPDLNALSQECEKSMTAVYAALTACEENLKLSAGEIYLWHFWGFAGHYIFLPGIPNLGILYTPKGKANGWRWHLNAKLVDDMLVCLRRLSRLLYTIQLGLAEEMTPEVKEALLGLYPPGLLCQLAQAFSMALQHLAQSWFSGKLSGEELQRLADTLQELQATSDAHHRNLVAWLTQTTHSGRKHTGTMSLYRNAPAATAAADAAARAVPAAGPAMDACGAAPFAFPGMGATRAASAAVPVAMAPAASRAASATPPMAAAPAGPSKVTGKLPTGRLPSVARTMSMPSGPSALGSSGMARQPSTFLRQPVLPGIVSDAAAAAAAADPATEPVAEGDSLREPLLGAAQDVLEPPAGAAQSADLEAGTSQKDNSSAGTPGGLGDYIKAPTFIRRLLPMWGVSATASPAQDQGKDTPLSQAGPTATPGAEAPAGGAPPPPLPPSMVASDGLAPAPSRGLAGGLLQQVLLQQQQEQHQQQAAVAAHGSRAVALQQAAQGHIAQVRWASFEWLVGELCEELEETYTAADALLRSLPHPL